MLAPLDSPSTTVAQPIGHTQGEVEQIAMMKPKGAAPGEEGMLEYLEDIIGSNA